MKILWLATKAPWPPVDGGRLLMDLTLRALRDQGHRVTVVAPLRPGDEEPEVPAGLSLHLVRQAFRPKLRDVLASWPIGKPFSIQRHHCVGCVQAVRRLSAEQSFDLIHVEQVHAVANLPDAAALPPQCNLPIVLRAQNVESDLWRSLAKFSGRRGPLLRFEAERLASFEGRAQARCRITVALTKEDRDRLATLAPTARPPATLAPPFPDRLSAGGETPSSWIAGDPSLVILGSSGWIPNDHGTDWFLRQIWPGLRRQQPACRLYLFGRRQANDPELGVHGLPAPRHSAEAFVPGSVLVVPLHIASGIRMKILEAWARGIPVIATSTAAAGLGAQAGRDYFCADTVEQHVQAVAALRRPEVYQGMVQAGHRRLQEAHDPQRVTEKLVQLYRQAIEDHRRSS